MTEPNTIYFYGARNPLSNFYPAKVIWSDHTFPTSEHAYQWAKFDVHRPDLALKIQMAASPSRAKRIARDNRNYVDEEFHINKLEIMYLICFAKLQQNKDVLKFLLETGDAPLVEASPHDDFWGYGKHRNGANWMGKTYMQLRDDFTIARI